MHYRMRLKMRVNMITNHKITIVNTFERPINGLNLFVNRGGLEFSFEDIVEPHDCTKTNRRRWSNQWEPQVFAEEYEPNFESAYKQRASHTRWWASTQWKMTNRWRACVWEDAHHAVAIDWCLLLSKWSFAENLCYDRGLVGSMIELSGRWEC